MRRDYFNQAEYYREQASRVRKRAELAQTRDDRESLLDLASRWETLASSAEPGAPGIDDRQIRREAEMFARRFPENPAAEAARFAGRAQAAGDQADFDLWSRITKAILEMDGKPGRKQRLH